MSDPQQTGDLEITITLLASHWDTVVEHLRRGVCDQVFDTLVLIYHQCDAALIERQKKAERPSEPVIRLSQDEPVTEVKQLH